MPKVKSTGYKKGMYHAIFEHKKKQLFVIYWNVDESQDNYNFKVNVVPYVENKGDKHDGFSQRADEKDKTTDTSNPTS